MDIRLVERVAFSVVGQEGCGPSSEGWKWVPPLWQALSEKISDIGDLFLCDMQGNPLGAWGAMTDMTRSFMPWTEAGRYLAGFEVAAESVAPSGWSKWDIPGYRYLVAGCTQTSYQEVFYAVLHEYMPKERYELVGAVHEYYGPGKGADELELYFPIAKL